MMYVLCKDVKLDPADEKAVTVFFEGWKPSSANGKISPVWGHPHLDGLRSTAVYPDLEALEQVLKVLPEQFLADAYIATADFVGVNPAKQVKGWIDIKRHQIIHMKREELLEFADYRGVDLEKLFDETGEKAKMETIQDFVLNALGLKGVTPAKPKAKERKS